MILSLCISITLVAGSGSLMRFVFSFWKGCKAVHGLCVKINFNFCEQTPERNIVNSQNDRPIAPSGGEE